MKAKTLIPILLLLISAFMNSQEKRIDLTLIVDTDNITQENINETCKFETQAPGTNITDFLTKVKIGDEVKWRIKKKDGSHGSVNLVKFKHENGVKVFKKDEIREKNGKIKGTVEAGNIGEEEKYTIEIKVNGRGQNSSVYSIDPKLKLIP